MNLEVFFMILYITIASVGGFSLGIISQPILRRFHKIYALSIPVVIGVFLIFPSMICSTVYKLNALNTLESVQTYLFNECKVWTNWFFLYTFLGSVIFYPLEKGFKKYLKLKK